MTAVTSREVVHHFSGVTARIAAGEELTVTRYDKPVLKLVRLIRQVVGEFMNVVLRKKAMTHAQAFEAVSLLSQVARVLGASQQAYEQAWKLTATHNKLDTP